MKERGQSPSEEPNKKPVQGRSGEERLTTRPPAPYAKERDIFMAENGEGQKPQGQDPNSTPNQSRRPETGGESGGGEPPRPPRDTAGAQGAPEDDQGSQKQNEGQSQSQEQQRQDRTQRQSKQRENEQQMNPDLLKTTLQDLIALHKRDGDSPKEDEIKRYEAFYRRLPVNILGETAKEIGDLLHELRNVGKPNKEEASLKEKNDLIQSIKDLLQNPNVPMQLYARFYSRFTKLIEESPSLLNSLTQKDKETYQQLEAKIKKEPVEHEKSDKATIDEKIKSIKEGSLSKDTANNFASLRWYLNMINDSIKKGSLILTKENKEIIEEALSIQAYDAGGRPITDTDVLKRMQNVAERLEDEVQLSNYFDKENVKDETEGEELGLPSNLDRLILRVMDSAPEEYRRGREKALMDEENNINYHNFLDWMRYRAWDEINTNPNSRVNILGLSVPARGYYNISIEDMARQARYIRREKYEFSGDETQGKEHVTGRKYYYTDKFYEKFRTKSLLYEAWLITQSHERSLIKLTRANDKGVVEQLAGTFRMNIMTDNGEDESARFILMAKLPKRDKEQLRRYVEEEEAGDVGYIFNILTRAYYHLAELGDNDERTLKDNEFYNTLGATRVDNLWKFMIRKSLNRGTQAREQYKGYINGRVQELLTQHRSRLNDAEINEVEREIASLGTKNASELPEEIDESPEYQRIKAIIYPKINKQVTERDSYQEHEKLGLSLLKTAYGFERKKLNYFNDSNAAPELKILVDDALVETVCKDAGLEGNEQAYITQWVRDNLYWTLTVARNDTGGVGYFAKYMNTGFYRKRQTGGNEIGNPYNIDGWKHGLSYLDALRFTKVGGNEEAKTLIQILGEMAKKKTTTDKYVGPGQQEANYSDLMLLNQVELFEWLRKTRRIQWEGLKRTQFGEVESHELEEKLLGPNPSLRHFIQYGFDMIQPQYDASIRTWDWEYETDTKGNLILDEQGRPKSPKKVFKTVTIREHMFDEEVLKMGMYDRFKTNPLDKEKAVLRNYFFYIIEKDLQARRTAGSGYPGISLELIHMIGEFFQRREITPEEVETEEGKKNPKRQGMLDEYEWNKIVHMAHATDKEMLREEGWAEVLSVLTIFLGRMWGSIVRSSVPKP